MEKISTDIYSFRRLRENGFTYVDKTAMTTFLTDALRKNPLDFSTISIDQSALEAYEPENPRLVTLLYQTGYLTIKGFHQLGLMRTFDLCIPNLEVENSFLTQLAPVFAGKTVRKLGLSFSSEKRTIVDVKSA